MEASPRLDRRGPPLDGPDDDRGRERPRIGAPASPASQRVAPPRPPSANNSSAASSSDVAAVVQSPFCRRPAQLHTPTDTPSSTPGCTPRCQRPPSAAGGSTRDLHRLALQRSALETVLPSPATREGDTSKQQIDAHTDHGSEPPPSEATGSSSADGVSPAHPQHVILAESLLEGAAQAQARARVRRVLILARRRAAFRCQYRGKSFDHSPSATLMTAMVTVQQIRDRGRARRAAAALGSAQGLENPKPATSTTT